LEDIIECRKRSETNCSHTWHEDFPPSSRPSPTTRTRRHLPTHTAMLKKCFVGDMCTPYRKKITSNQDRVGCVQALLIWRGLEGVTCVYGIRNGRHSNTIPRDVHGGVFLSYSILRLMRIGNLRASLRESSPDRDLLTKGDRKLFLRPTYINRGNTQILHWEKKLPATDRKKMLHYIVL